MGGSNAPFGNTAACSGIEGVGSLDISSDWTEDVDIEGEGVVVLRGLDGRRRVLVSPFILAVGLLPDQRSG